MSKTDHATVTALASAACADGALVEMVHDPIAESTRLCVFREGASSIVDTTTIGDQECRPYSAKNNLLKNRVLLFASAPADYGSEQELAEAVQSFVHRHVSLTPLFEKIAAHYVLLSWVYDAFDELPYLRVRGDFGSGKTRFLRTVGSLCYKPIFASGASTTSPLFRILDAFQGTLVLDEADFRFSDEKAELTKILNNGNARGFPVLRTEVTGRREFDPRAYAVYGPKLIATRASFEDRALESRCITEDLGLQPLREDVPISLPPSFHDEARALRNQLLTYRFLNRSRYGDVRVRPERGIEPRLSQVFAPLLAVIGDDTVADEVRALARASSRQLMADRGMDAEGHLLDVLHGLVGAGDGRGLPLGAIAAAFLERFGSEYDWKVTSRWVGTLLRGRLQLRPRKSDGVFVLPVSEFPKLKLLFKRYGIGTENEETPPDRDIRDFRDIAEGSEARDPP